MMFRDLRYLMESVCMQGKRAYSQQGEDLIIDSLLKSISVEKPFYLDIGANHPIKLSNTYFFYRKGASGICIEPNTEFRFLYSIFRRRDQLLNIGLTGGSTSKAQYYIMDWHEFNTFDKEHATALEAFYKGRNAIQRVVELPILNVNEFIQKYVRRPIDLINLDVEGLDYDILSAFDFNAQTPKVICVETKDFSNGKEQSKIHNHLTQKGYILYAMNPINGIYVHSNFVK